MEKPQFAKKQIFQWIKELDQTGNSLSDWSRNDIKNSEDKNLQPILRKAEHHLSQCQGFLLKLAAWANQEKIEDVRLQMKSETGVEL